MASDYKATAIVLKPNPAQLQAVAEELREIPNGLQRALALAINKTLAKGQTTLIDGLTALLAAKRGNILGKKDNRRIRVVKASAGNLSGRIKILQRPIGLINFEVKDTRTGATGSRKGRRQKGWNRAGSGQGVIARIRKDEAPIVLPKAFIAMGLSNNRHVFERFGVKRKQEKAHYLPNVGRNSQPIHSFKGLSLHTVWKDSPRLRQQVQDRISEELPKDIASQVDHLLQRKKTT